jgi:hypothetical protein
MLSTVEDIKVNQMELLELNKQFLKNSLDRLNRKFKLYRRIVELSWQQNFTNSSREKENEQSLSDSLKNIKGLVCNWISRQEKRGKEKRYLKK